MTRQDLDRLASELVRRVENPDTGAAIPLDELRETFRVLVSYHKECLRDRRDDEAGRTFMDFAGVTEEPSNVRIAQIPNRGRT